ncbi:DNRLRE domain-containing protein [Streptomyces sp. NPDC059575]|uniref:DNRLRE domain-containing protein n=1 Tax=Streptomyces sp. NPDC059575 TaxID=3346872 RepID=UPI00367E09F2
MSVTVADGTAVATEPQSVQARTPTNLGPAEAGDEASALLLARLQDRRIEILGARTEDTTTWANPYGTVTVESFTGPIRVKDAKGGWQPVDMTLTQAHGQVEPKAAAADIAFSAGGDTAPLAQVTRGTKTLGVAWEGPLPKPVLKGNTATYPNAVPGGDLVVSALPEGFSHSVVLRERPTGPVEFHLPVAAEGLTLTEEADKRLHWEDARGTKVAAAPPPLMWGAAEDAKSQEPERAATVSTTVETAADGAQTLVLKPSEQFLSDPDVTYPVVVDPTNTLAGATTDTWVQYDDYPASQRGSTELKAGTYDSTEKARSFLKFDVSAYAGKKIVDTDLRLYSYYSSTCSTSNSGNQVRRITSDWDPSAISWSAQPSTTTTGAVTSTAAKGYNSSCPAGRVSWDVDTIVQAWADGQPNYGVRLAAADETDPLTWRRYRSANYVDGSHNPDYEPSLTVTYNTKPGLATLTYPASGSFTADTTPTLKANATDADGNSVLLRFEVWDSAGTTRVTSGDAPYVASGATASWTSPALAAGAYKWRVAVYDGTSWNGNWSSWRTFTVDTSVPAAPTVTSAVYPADGLWHGDAGQAGAFRIADAAGTASAAEYSFDDGTTLSTTLTGGAANVSLTPTSRGTHTLTARVKNAAGTWSAWREYTFRAGAITGNLSTSFINDIAETHFGETLHPAVDADEEVIDFPEETVVEEDDTPPGYVEEVDPERVETEESAPAVAVGQLPADAGQSIVGTSPDGNTKTLVDLPPATASPAELSSTGLVIYANTQIDADTVAVRTGTGSVEVFHLLRSANAPQSFSYRVDLQPGQEITPVDNNTLMVSDAQGDASTFISAPEAFDALGNSIPVSMRLSGNNIIVSLAPAAGQTVHYPILLDPGYGFGDLTPAEKRYCTTNPYDCDKAHKDAEKAFKEAQDRYPDNTLFQGTGDAFRHCYWNARMEINIDHETAYEVATRHESESRGVDKEMDLRNNKIGRKIGRDYRGKSRSNYNARDKCISYVKKGSLWKIKSGKLVKSNA